MFVSLRNSALLAVSMALSCSTDDSPSGTDGTGGKADPGATTTGGSVGVGAGGVVPSSAGGDANIGGSAVGGLSSATVGGSGGATVGSGGTDGSGGATVGSGGTDSSGGATVGSGGTDGSGGATVGSGGATDGALPMGNTPIKSPACGTASSLNTQEYTIVSSGQERKYYIDLPSNYDIDKPYRLFYTSHWISSRWEDVEGQDFYFLKPLIEADGEQAIFVAPSSDGATWQEKDHALFDDILAHLKDNICFDTTRVFATGFSFGGMITYSLSTNHQQDIRAAVGIAPANYNIWLPQKSRMPIAWMHMTGLSDGTCPWINDEQQERGAKFIALEKASDNGCTLPNDIPVWQNGDHSCYDFEDCDPEHPTRVCTFGGGHTNIDSDPGSNENWIPEESWAFFKQF